MTKKTTKIFVVSANRFSESWVTNLCLALITNNWIYKNVFTRMWLTQTNSQSSLLANLPIHYNLFVAPKMSMCGALSHSGTGAEQWKLWVTRHHVPTRPSRLRSHKAALCLLVAAQTTVLSAVYRYPFLCISVFCWWFHWLKWPPV